MESAKTIESMGFVLKKETLSLLESEHKFSELILEDLDPYPGFYDHFHIPLSEEEKKPRSIFALTKDMTFVQMDEFIRNTNSVKSNFGTRFDAVIGRLMLQNNPVTCIRIYMDDYTALPLLIERYKQSGIEFLPYRTVKPYSSLITIRKFMRLEKIVPNFYRDLELKDTYYFKVDKYVQWSKFETISINIRNNNNHKVYDAAQAGYYNPDGIVEMIRIYDPKATLDNLIFLKEKYDIEIERSLYQLA